MLNHAYLLIFGVLILIAGLYLIKKAIEISNQDANRFEQELQSIPAEDRLAYAILDGPDLKSFFVTSTSIIFMLCGAASILLAIIPK